MMEVRLADHCEITSSKRIYAKEYEESGIPFFRGKEIVEKYNGQSAISSELFISETRYEQIKQSFGVPHRGDILLTSVGTIGVPYRVDIDEPFYFKDGNLTWFRNFRGIDSQYLFYWLVSPLGRRELSKCTIGAAQPAYTIVRLKEMRLDLPDERTQRAISGYLKNYDDLIENNKRRIELLEESARQLYKEWFVRFRFPGHEHVKIIDGVPEGWVPTTLGAVATTNALSHKAKELPDEINYIDISSVSTGRVLTKNHMLSEDASGRARRISQHGDVIWSNVRPNLRAYALVLHPEEIDVFSTGFTVLSGTEIPYSFLYNFTTTDNFVNHLVNHTTGASYPAVRPPDFERAELLLPPQSLLEQYHEICEPNFELSYVLAEQNVQLAAARDLLLPKLMSGEIAV